MTSNRVLAAIDWDGGFSVPVANAENKALENEVRLKEKELMLLEDKLEDRKDRIQALSQHMRNLTQELSHTQALCKAKARETESERNFKVLAERETGHLRQELGKLQKELDLLRDRRNTQESNIFKATQKLEKLRNQLNWDQQTLDAWLEESAHKDEDTMAIIKYAAQDERRIKSLTVAIEKKTLEANQRRKTLDNELTETLSAQIALDKTAENFRWAHLERQELIQQWENTIKQMRKRDAELEQCALKLAEVNQEIRQRNANITEKNNFLESEIENNKENERKIAMANRQAAKLRRELQELENNRNRLKGELESLKGTVERAAMDVKTLRSQMSCMKKDIQDKTNKLKESQLLRGGLEEKLKMVTQTALSVEERAFQIEQMFKDEEQAIKEMDAQLYRHREVLFHQKQDLQAQRMKEKDFITQLSGSKAAISSLDSDLTKLDHNSLKQQKVIDNQDFHIQQLEKKMARLRGDINKQEKQVLEKKMAELTSGLEEKQKTAHLLTSQLKELEDYIRCVRKETEKTGAEKSDLTTKIEELHLSNDIADKDLRKLRLHKQDTMVEDSILKLEVKRLRDLLYNKADSVLSLEKRRLELQTAMREREEEIKVYRDMLSKQVRIEDQERQRHSAEMHERLSKVNTMQKRYEILTISMAAPEGEEEKSQAYYVIKAAQEKEELKRKGDSLDAKIRKMEKEIKALENTIQLVNNCNSAFRKSLNKVNETSEEYQEKLRLEEQQRAAIVKYKYQKRQIKELEEDIQIMNSTLESLLQEGQKQEEHTTVIQSHFIQLNKELASQKEKLDRATKQCSKLTKEIHSANKTQLETFEEQDIELRETREFNKTTDRMLLDAMRENADLAAVIEKYFLQVNVPLPSPASIPASRQSSYTNSARSSVSSRSVESSASSSPRSSALQSATPKTTELGLGLTVTSPPTSASPRSSSAASSGSSHSQHKSP
ncbi:coiled-coil domain-containing protein 39 [Lampris incognitus]|uniref:coiled-coil domain-containing protein 39 n=1 Tax=Lampris incognitus TaxID=2546036 RepID=UPI0024B4E2F3|nr:coiled-coil domain-containing protein 39 [Lampris incognitus]